MRLPNTQTQENTTPSSSPSQATATLQNDQADHYKADDFHHFLIEQCEAIAAECNRPKPTLSFDFVILPSLAREQANQVMSQAYQNFVLAMPELIRNSILHGLESEQERKDAGKQALGNIIVTALFGKNRIELHYWDDGRGLNINDLYLQGEEMELLDIIPSPDLDDIAALLINEQFTQNQENPTSENKGLIETKKNLSKRDYKLLLRVTSDEVLHGFTPFKCVLKKNIH